MEINELINKILVAKSIKELIDINNYDSECKGILKKVHPDVCKESNANNAFVKFMELKSLFDNGFIFDDDAGKVTIKERIVTFSGNQDLINKSIDNYNKIYRGANDNFKKYLPNSFSKNEMILDDCFLSLKDVTLPEEHVRWVVSRLMEFSGYLENAGFAHIGLTIDSFLVNPKTHGIKVISFYHMKPIGSRLDTISAKYRVLYPNSVFDKKLAESKIDTELTKRTACFLLGDTSGVGVKLKKTVSDAFIQFLLKTNANSIEAFLEYKKLLKDNYESKFYELKL